MGVLGYGRHLAGGWRSTYVVGAVLSLYLNVFVFVMQEAFLKVPALKARAPTQPEPPFALTQRAVLLLFAILTVAAVRFRISERAAGAPVGPP